MFINHTLRNATGSTTVFVLRRRLLAGSLGFLILVMATTTALSQESREDPIVFTATGINDNTLQALSVENPIPADQTSSIQDYVLVSINPFLGPVGTAYVPPGIEALGDLKGVENTVNKNFQFPSIYFHISLAPKFQPITETDGPVKTVKYEDRDVEWVNVTVEIKPSCKETKENDKPSCEAWLLWLLPDDTLAGTREQLPTRVAQTLTELGGVISPFLPPSTLASGYTAGVSGLGVLFRQLFPPKAVQYQYSYIDSIITKADPKLPDEGTIRFGWYYRRDTTNPNTASILGLHHTVALLQADSNVKSLDVTYRSLSRWNKRPSLNGDRIHFMPNTTVNLVIPQPTQEERDYTLIRELSTFPVLVHRETVLKLLHIKPEDLDGLIESGKLSTVTGEGQYVLRSSLERLLGLQKAANQSAENSDANSRP